MTKFMFCKVTPKTADPESGLSAFPVLTWTYEIYCHFCLNLNQSWATVSLKTGLVKIKFYIYRKFDKKEFLLQYSLIISKI